MARSDHRSLEVQRAATKFARPFRIAGYTFNAMPSVIAAVHQQGCTGRGEAAGVYYLGDDQDNMVAALEQVRPAIERGADRQELQSLLPSGGARNALDCALWELESLQTGTPVWVLAGVSRPTPRITTFTLPADQPSELADKVKDFDFAKAIKLKLDGDVELDRERIAVVRAARPDVWLGVDANQGFSGDDLDALEQMVRDFKVSLVEQPVRRGDEATLTGWRGSAPLAADESILNLSELAEKAKYFDVINIKLDKCGGLTEGLSMARVSNTLGKQVMVGNMGGSTLAMAPSFVVAQLCDFVDLDGPWGLADDSLVSEIYRDGEIYVPDSLWGSG